MFININFQTALRFAQNAFEQQSYDRCYEYIIGCGVCVAIVLFNIINAERGDNSLHMFEYANRHKYNVTMIYGDTNTTAINLYNKIQDWSE